MDRGIRISKLTAKLEHSVDLTPFLGKLQQHGIVKIVYDPALDEEPLVQLTDKGRQELFELFFPNDEKES
ncbi:MAG TPA: hypothetical protein VK253_05710 [Candidatus Binatia bacterium]|nr:hypothetical protein [Candidatus Binatia bacterium]